LRRLAASSRVSRLRLTLRYHGAVRLNLAILYVNDIPRMTAFYRDVFGLTLESHSETYVKFENFALQAIPKEAAVPISSPPRVRDDNAAKLIFTLENVATEVSRLEEMGARILRHPWGTWDVIDPEGNVIGISAGKPR
jgi:predicted enzyme related to lactoylglutathione lyase